MALPAELEVTSRQEFLKTGTAEGGGMVDGFTEGV